MSRRRVISLPEIGDDDIAEALAAVLRPMRCPWCQRPLQPYEMHYRPRLNEPARPNEAPAVYLACEPCAWDMDGGDVPLFRVIH